jgi:putative phosphoribosyl transferase
VRFRDRGDAGRRLAGEVAALSLRDPVILGLPRGGIPVAAEVAALLGASLDVFVARKVGAPGHEELGIGAVAEGSDTIVASDAAHRLGIAPATLSELAARARAELERRVSAYRGDRALPALTNRDVVLVDDGIATGVTSEAALRAIRDKRPRRLVLAVPVCAPDTAERLAGVADAVVAVLRPRDFAAVGEWYDDFGQTTDDEVRALLERWHPSAG